MSRLARLAGAVAIAGVGSLGHPGGAPAADPATATAGPAAPAPVLRVADGLVTARAVAAPLGALLERLARQTGVRIDVAVEPGERVTAALDAVPLEEALARLLEGRPRVFVYEPDRADRAVPGGGRLVAVLGYGRDDRAPPPGAGLIPPPAAGSTAAPRGAAAASLASLSRDLAHGNADVRERAARALGRIRDPAAVEALAASLSEDPASRVREAAADALGRTWDEAAAPALERALARDPGRGVREAAARALGDVASPARIDALVQALQDPRGSVREGAVAALGMVGGADAIQALATAAEGDPDPWVRDDARTALREALDD